MLLFGAFSSVHAYAEAINILALHSYHDGLPWTQEFREGLRQAQIEHPEINYYTEYLDAARTGESLTDGQWAEYLVTKYRSTRIDVIIGESGPAADLVSTYPELFGPIPQVIYSPTPRETPPFLLAMRPQIGAAITGTAEIALAQNPDARTAIVINGGNPATSSTLEILYSALDEADIEIEELKDFTIAELRDRLENGDPHAIVFYTLVFRDSTGERFVPREVLEDLSELSAAPIYTFWGTFVGAGAVGGTMIDGRVAAYEAVRASLDYIWNGSFGGDYGTTQTHIDWSVLKAHGIGTDTIPPDSIVANRPEPFFVTYYVESVTVASILLLFAFLVVFILLRRNLTANRQLRVRSEELRKALEQKDILFREMNNRIKNNLAILTSLLFLQIDELSDERQRLQFQNFVGRLRTLALVHEELSREEAITETNTREFLNSLILQVLNAMKPEPTERWLRIEIEEIRMENKNAIACGLIVHELFTNAIRFAFPANDSGTIHVRLARRIEGEIELTVKDSGTGFPQSFDVDLDAGLGLKIVRSLVHQLNGSLDLRNADGAMVAVTFRV